MIIPQVRDEVLWVDHLLDEYEVTGKGRGQSQRRMELLERAVLASVRAIEGLISEPFTQDPAGYLDDMTARLKVNPWAIAEELRQDAALLRSFLAAECRLLEDLGLSRTTVAQLRSALAEAITEGISTPEGFAPRLDGLLALLARDLDRLQNDKDHRMIRDRLTSVLQVLGGALVVAGNAMVGTTGAPVTGGLSLGGAAVSAAAGADVMTRGLRRAQ